MNRFPFPLLIILLIIFVGGVGYGIYYLINQGEDIIDKKDIITCTSITPKIGYEITETKLRADNENWDVTATCADGYEGTPKITPCSKNGEVYTVTGCKKIPICSRPANKIGYEPITENNLERDSFDVTASCDISRGYEGTATVTRCQEDGQSYTLSGCSLPQSCEDPENVNQYILNPDKTNKTVKGFNLEVQSCADGYEDEGTPKITPCSKNGEVYTVTGCEEITCDIKPTPGYIIPTDQNKLTKTYQDIKNDPTAGVECDVSSGYTGNVTAICDKSGDMQLDGCNTYDCTTPEYGDNYTIGNEELNSSNFNVEASCSPGYDGTAQVTKCVKDGDPYTLSGCNTFGYVDQDEDSCDNLCKNHFKSVSAYGEIYNDNSGCINGWCALCCTATCAEDKGDSDYCIDLDGTYGDIDNTGCPDSRGWSCDLKAPICRCYKS